MTLTFKVEGTSENDTEARRFALERAAEIEGKGFTVSELTHTTRNAARGPGRIHVYTFVGEAKKSDEPEKP